MIKISKINIEFRVFTKTRNTSFTAPLSDGLERKNYQHIVHQLSTRKRFWVENVFGEAYWVNS